MRFNSDRHTDKPMESIIAPGGSQEFLLGVPSSAPPSSCSPLGSARSCLCSEQQLPKPQALSSSQSQMVCPLPTSPLRTEVLFAPREGSFPSSSPMRWLPWPPKCSSCLSELTTNTSKALFYAFFLPHLTALLPAELPGQ